jgi:hypothetical protein
VQEIRDWYAAQLAYPYIDIGAIYRLDVLIFHVFDVVVKLNRLNDISKMKFFIKTTKFSIYRSILSFRTTSKT